MFGPISEEAAEILKDRQGREQLRKILDSKEKKGIVTISSGKKFKINL